MKIYKVTRGNSYTDNAGEIFFTSRGKAIGYIIGRYAESQEKPHGRARQSSANFCYAPEKLFDSKNWNKYFYIIKGEFFYIDVITVL